MSENLTEPNFSSFLDRVQHYVQLNIRLARNLQEAVACSEQASTLPLELVLSHQGTVEIHSLSSALQLNKDVHEQFLATVHKERGRQTRNRN